MNARLAATLDKLRRTCRCGHVHYATRCHVCKYSEDDLAPEAEAARDDTTPPAPSTRLERQQRYSMEVGAACLIGAALCIAAAILQPFVERLFG